MVKKKTPYGPSGEDASTGDSVDRLSSVQKAMLATPGMDPEDAAEDSYLDEDPDWLGLAKNAYEDSTSYLDSSLRSQWEKNERAFQSRHQPGSKYFADAYKGKSRLYRPKTRAMIRMGDAQVAASFFSNEDVISVTAANKNDSRSNASSDIGKYLLQHRLTSTHPNEGIRWFQTVVGAFQDGQKYGTVISKQYWKYRTIKIKKHVPEIDENTGQPMLGDEGNPILREVIEEQVVENRPACDLIPIENFRIDRAADWRDPIATSPYIIVLHPMYVHEVEERQRMTDTKTGQPKWLPVDRTALKKSSTRQGWDSTRQQREGNREDSKEDDSTIDEFSIVWVHENIIRWNGRDWVFWTVGEEEMLSDPKPLTEVYPQCDEGERPFSLGNVIIETHKTYTSGKPELVAGLQMEANDLVNLRLDNVKLALNKRYIVRRGRQVDLRSLVRNVSGSITLANDVDDVKTIDTRDVTQSSYEEQNRINIDYDDVAGQFNTGTVQANRHLNETVGGMEMLSGSANLISELDLRTFVETWAEPTLRQIMKLEQRFEDDVVLITLAGENAELWHKYGINRIDDELLEKDLLLRVNVGIGATDPMQRLNKISTAAKIIGEIFGDRVARFMNDEEIIKEIFGNLGYRDGSRFFKFDVDPDLQEAMDMIQQLQQELESGEADRENRVATAKLAAISKILVQQLENQGAVEKEKIRGAQDQKKTMFDSAASFRADRAKADDERQRQMDAFRQTLLGGMVNGGNNGADGGSNRT